MQTIINDVTNEVIINKSKFITKIYKVRKEEDVKIILDNLKLKYKDATHICFAYIIDNTKRFNDNGEPGGTAGMPILNVLENNNLNYVLAVVIRYFGGIKLGAGGLVRAYSNSVSEVLLKDNLKELEQKIKIIIKFNYDNTKQIDYLLRDVCIENKSFDDVITYTFLINLDKYNLIKKELLNNCLSIKEKELIWD